MKIALGIVRLFPGGGLQSDCLRIARLLQQGGHEVRLFAARRDGDIDPAVDVALLPVRALSNAGGDLAFARRFAAATHGRFDRVVGFNKLLDLDVLYCADPCVLGLGRHWIERMLPRHRLQVRLEAASFAPDASTRIIMLAQRQADDYRRHWHTPDDRLTIIPPGANRERRQPGLRATPQRQAPLASLDLGPHQQVWLWVGAQPRTKGLDRVLAALARFESAVLLVAGLTDETSRLVLKQAADRGIAGRVRSLGYRRDIPALMASADVLVHPARLDITGGVILEAVNNGLPVVTSAVCGFAEHVRSAQAGEVIPEPFAQAAFEAAIGRLLEPGVAARMSDNGARYGENPRLYAGLDAAVDVILRAMPER